MIAIIDYDAGNLKSVEKAFLHIGEEAIITRNQDEILSADKVILPGVGAFGDAMHKLHSYHLVDTIKKVVDNGTPLLGICLGLQLLFESSEESVGVKGLSILEGEIVKIPENNELKIPHIGWNSLEVREGAKLFQGLPQNPYVYFVHSYYLKAKNENEVAATTDYSTVIHASVEKDNIYGCQFHPEKSGDVGLQILRNFAKLA
ncbi:imidazole glycerol phosphate synthase subunit HisH [Clostridium sp. Marseille-P299]|uniref:imidazole glycerol phosphate synthase subunit HisH n=1 Tax=Clostridium sp. Marseille-P299 TaxID=1805477 RepID=UPI00083644F4|nr:imidazole glycerol phosphate synthase subunit HisH [Clostridium sp. Marseille-P299]